MRIINPFTAVACEDKKNLHSSCMWGSYTPSQQLHVRIIYPFTAVACEDHIPLYSSCMWGQKKPSQQLHVRIIYPFTAVACEDHKPLHSSCMWGQKKPSQQLHVRTIYPFTAVACEDHIPLHSSHMWGSYTPSQQLHVRKQSVTRGVQRLILVNSNTQVLRYDELTSFEIDLKTFSKLLKPLLMACVRISGQFKVRLNVVERWVCIHNQYLYTSSIHQKPYKSRHKYHEILMHLVSFHGSVHNDMIPNLI